MSDPKEDQPKIIVDDDWKEQARKEKEEADRQSREAADNQGLPPPHIGELVQMIMLQASIGLGGYQDPQTGQRIPPQLPLAKHYIDLLELLIAKTKGNLDEEEQRLLEGTTHELRMAFVQVAGLGGPSRR